ncbi:BZ3500_MvSof-1268-A1-R1_Chr7-1g09256 [Microbotryum saponariae]|uniref:BZ3500_MvSof-1268-A1-R1_Chr7-1g09256 protein n=1 Tax=Microbotryum saponariae TaxID=289078 RepID=A0A2X0L023_9BASI|nr:BZ3501_MvSof-1269-A2-R1_Chr7-1g08961 [Microbotryum saponariae]SDA03098.1 BZ3500_MvSof-1268-A1-R1_Chr7-1g09256 [Microbotryum saponariae]
MSFRASLRRLASHAPRQPSIHFPDRSAAPVHHLATPHPCAPSDILSSSPFLQSLSKRPTTPSEPHQGPKTPLSGPAGGAEDGAGFVGPKADYEEGDSGMPSWLNKARYAPGEEEIEAVLSGGATAATEVTKAYKQKWWTAQV